MPLLLASAICKTDENSHQEFTRKEINQLYGYSQNQLYGYSQLHIWYFIIKSTTRHFLVMFNLQLENNKKSVKGLLRW